MTTRQVFAQAAKTETTSPLLDSTPQGACFTIVFKLTERASKNWRCLNGSELIGDTIAGVVFADGVKEQKPRKAAAGSETYPQY